MQLFQQAVGQGQRLLHSAAAAAARSFPAALGAGRFVVLVTLGVGQDAGPLHLSLEPSQGAVKGFVLTNSDFGHLPTPSSGTRSPLTAGVSDAGWVP